MSLAVDTELWGWVRAAWTWKVVQRNAPGAISAMAFTVMPVRVRLFFISTGWAVAAISHLSVCRRVGTRRCQVRTRGDTGRR